jgi:hypothetical protein
MPGMKRYLLGAAFLLGAASVRCATGGTGETLDGSIDTTSPEPEGGLFDQTAPQDITQADTAPSPDSTAFDTVTPFDVVPPTETSTDSGGDAATDAAKDAESEASVACKDNGKLCNYAADDCPIFYECYLAYPALDAGADSGALEGGLGPVNDGVCISGFYVPPSTVCDDGMGHCAATVKCLSASQMCLNATLVSCICDNPLTASACGPP